MQEKIRIIIDTNVFVSACLKTDGPSNRVIKLLKNTNVLKLVLSPEVVEEYIRVANYERISKKYFNYAQNALNLIEKLSTMASFYEPVKKFMVLKDTEDNKFLDLAYKAKAHYLITGNHKDFTITEFEQTKILNPKTFCDLYEQNKL